MIEPDIVVDKRGPLELRVLFDRVKRNWVFEDRGIQIVSTVMGKTVQADGNDGGDGSHVQEGLKQRSKTRGLIYSGIDPKRIMPNLYIGVPQGCGHGRSNCGRREATVAERSVLQRSSIGQVAE